MSDLPRGWEWAALNEIAEVRLGRQRSPKNHSGTHMRPYLRAANVSWEGLKLDDVKEMNFTDDELETYRLLPGDIVVGEASGSPGEVGKPAIWNGEITDCCFQNTLIRVRSLGPDPRYLLYFLRSEALRGAFVAEARGVGIHHLGAARLSSWQVPVPPLAEQRRIVRILDERLTELEGVRIEVASSLERARRLHESVLASAVSGGLSDRVGSPALAGERAAALDAERARRYSGSRGRPIASLIRDGHGFRFPSEWVVRSLEQVTDPTRTISYGILKPGPNVPDGIPYVRVVNMRGDELSLRDLHRTAPAISGQYHRSTLRSGDVLVSIRGTYGRVVAVPPDLDGANITQDTARLAFIDGVDPSFACIYLRSPQVQRYLRSIARGVAVKGVNIADLREVPFPVPDMDEQRRIATAVDRLFSKLDAGSALADGVLKRGIRLRASVLAEAFAGRLVEQDPADEPASELLARIRAQRVVVPKQRGRRTAKELAAPATRAIGTDFQQGELPL
ncbi:restriction endonuclease subunit S [Solwaraspora sp. WMMA2059]|uniref:restriction endonuclease subunit S n=1 Tax=Solwaraspora sp. WMMA2059 TaxID=3015160 RepID=UPI00248B01AD|nr:restriction endonuclease subunit S [Solwaraspora sp. WMMA2059]WBB98009.1 restriction endonuclease subunit S [Solwaraspora sp. WMMA2059]